MSTEEPSFYIDKFANKVEVSNQYTARVPVITGHFPIFEEKDGLDARTVWGRLLPIIIRIHDDAFLHAMLEQIHILRKEISYWSLK